MGFIKGVLFGVAAYAAVQHITKKDMLTGRSILDDLLERAPEYIDKAKIYAEEVEINVRQSDDPYNEFKPV